MGQRRQEQRLNQIADYIKNNPDLKAGQVARQLSVDNKTVQRSLAYLETRGDLLQEDDKGRLSWFGRRQ